MHAGLLDGSLLCRCVVAGAKFPSSAGLVAKIFKPLLLSPPSPAREQALKALSRKLGASENSQPPSDIGQDSWLIRGPRPGGEVPRGSTWTEPVQGVYTLQHAEYTARELWWLFQPKHGCTINVTVTVCKLVCSCVIIVASDPHNATKYNMAMAASSQSFVILIIIGGEITRLGYPCCPMLCFH